MGCNQLVRLLHAAHCPDMSGDCPSGPKDSCQECTRGCFIKLTCVLCFILAEESAVSMMLYSQADNAWQCGSTVSTMLCGATRYVVWPRLTAQPHQCALGAYLEDLECVEPLWCILDVVHAGHKQLVGIDGSQS